MVDVAVTGPYGERFHEVLTDDALQFLAALHRAFDGRRRELLERRRQRYQELAEGGTLDFLAATKHIREDESWRVADPARGLVDRRAEISRSQVWQWLHNSVELSVGGDAFGKGRWDDARSLFTDTALADDFADFLTLPAYEQMP
jgi:malate synthase